MEQQLTDYKNAGYLVTKIVDGDELLHLAAPCRFRITENIVADLKRNYTSDEEIGGVLWLKPTTKEGEIIHIIDNVSYVRNAIEDNPRADHRNRSNAYLPDSKELHKTLNDLLLQGYLPVTFHSHPVKGTDFLQSLIYSNLMTETSDQDKRESSTYLKIGNKMLLMPRGLIVGNDISNSDIFIGVYNGFIAPTEFENSKKKIQQENLNKIADLVSAINLTDRQRVGMAIGAVLLLFVIAKYPKHSLPVIIGLVATLPLLMTNTHKIDNPNYFNKLSLGSADILIPKS